MIYFPSAIPPAAQIVERNAPMASAHLDALSARHASIDGQISAELLRPLPDATRITRLKRQKLRIKEELAAGSVKG